MKEYKAMAHIHSLNGEMAEISDFFQDGYFRHFAVQRVNMCYCFVFFHCYNLL